ncbi:MAG: hypothetical protein HZB38_15970 [Planctomycetes bacterium]|nr:hypothetical protein [Planctomycetota bacterium]
MPANPRRIFLSVAEDSADIHAAALMRAARRSLPEARFEGLTGPRTRAEGAETVFDLASHAAMLGGVFGVLGRAVRAIDTAALRWCTHRPDLVVLVDSPELHLPMAKKAQRLGIPVLYYIAPQTWASREYRVRTLRRVVDHLACILPFEEAYFRSFGVKASYVGHPLFESLKAERPAADQVESLRGDDRPLVALLPGSRGHVISTMLPLQLAVAESMIRKGRDIRIAVSVADPARLESIRALVAGSGFNCRVHSRELPDTEPNGRQTARTAHLVVQDNASLLTAADLVLVASGTATLHVAHYRKPMIVMYDAGPLFGHGHRVVGRWIVHTPHLSLVNVLSGTRLVPEFMPSVPSAEAVARVASDLLTDRFWREEMVRGLDALVTPLESSAASLLVCALMRSLGA